MKTVTDQYWCVSWCGGFTYIKAGSKYGAKKAVKHKHKNSSPPYSCRLATNHEIDILLKQEAARANKIRL